VFFQQRDDFIFEADLAVMCFPGVDAAYGNRVSLRGALSMGPELRADHPRRQAKNGLVGGPRREEERSSAFIASINAHTIPSPWLSHSGQALLHLVRDATILMPAPPPYARRFFEKRGLFSLTWKRTNGRVQPLTSGLKCARWVVFDN
jgi:hypothetical protein